MAVNINITIIELNALHNQRQNLSQVIVVLNHVLKQSKHSGSIKGENASGQTVKEEAHIALKGRIARMIFKRVFKGKQSFGSKISGHHVEQGDMSQPRRLFP